MLVTERLASMFIEESLLQGMRFLGRPETFDGDDVLAGCRSDRQLARSHCAVVHQHGGFRMFREVLNVIFHFHFY